MPVYDVKLPPGCVRVDLDRRGLQLGDRGGFVACWLSDAADTLDEASFREYVKAHLTAVYEAQAGQSAPKVLDLLQKST
jgi:hypothetical protein